MYFILNWNGDRSTGAELTVNEIGLLSTNILQFLTWLVKCWNIPWCETMSVMVHMLCSCAENYVLLSKGQVRLSGERQVGSNMTRVTPAAAKPGSQKSQM